jgi:hypothetical protein
MMESEWWDGGKQWVQYSGIKEPDDVVDGEAHGDCQLWKD